MELPIKHCGNCRASFTLTELAELPLVRTGTSANGRHTETRLCLCDAELVVAAEYLQNLKEHGGLSVSSVQYARDFPRSHRVPLDLEGAMVITDDEADAIEYAWRRSRASIVVGSVCIGVLVVSLLVTAFLVWEVFQ